MESLYGTKIYSRKIPGTIMTKEKNHMGKLKHQLNFSYFRIDPTRKITPTKTLGLAHCFQEAPSEEPSTRATLKLSYLRCYFAYHFPVLNHGLTKLYSKAHNIHIIS